MDHDKLCVCVQYAMFSTWVADSHSNRSVLTHFAIGAEIQCVVFMLPSRVLQSYLQWPLGRKGVASTVSSSPNTSLSGLFNYFHNFRERVFNLLKQHGEECMPHFPSSMFGSLIYGLSFLNPLHPSIMKRTKAGYVCIFSNHRLVGVRFEQQIKKLSKYSGKAAMGEMRMGMSLV